jgi:hypothetical protein
MSMSTPLDIAVDIGRILSEARATRSVLAASACADDLLTRHPATGLRREHVLAALTEEADAIGLPLD